MVTVTERAQQELATILRENEGKALRITFQGYG